LCENPPLRGPTPHLGLLPLSGNRCIFFFFRFSGGPFFNSFWGLHNVLVLSPATFEVILSFEYSYCNFSPPFCMVGGPGLCEGPNPPHFPLFRFHCNVSPGPSFVPHVGFFSPHRNWSSVSVPPILDKPLLETWRARQSYVGALLVPSGDSWLRPSRGKFPLFFLSVTQKHWFFLERGVPEWALPKAFPDDGRWSDQGWKCLGPNPNRPATPPVLYYDFAFSCFFTSWAAGHPNALSSNFPLRLVVFLENRLVFCGLFVLCVPIPSPTAVSPTQPAGGPFFTFGGLEKSLFFPGRFPTSFKHTFLYFGVLFC